MTTSGILNQTPPTISKIEFQERVKRIQQLLEQRGLHALLVYGDEYRKENLRYVSNFWPIFERAACIIPLKGEPILAGAPEGERYAKEMSVWTDIRNVKDFACVSVPEEIDYPLAKFSSFTEILKEAMGDARRLGIVGRFDMPAPIFDRVKSALPGQEVVDAGDLLTSLRLVKSETEIACLREAGRLACVGYEQLLRSAVPGATEREAAGAGEGASRRAGAETIIFTVMGAGERTNTIIGRPTQRIIRDGDMVMAAFAVQYEGYVATVEHPFVAGRASDAQKKLLDVLFAAADEQLRHLRDGVIAGSMVRAVRDVFRRHGVEQYDVYPPMHGAGLAEAESPYPDEKATYALRTGMCVNSDISLFGHPAGSNRIEEGFVIRENGPESITPLIRQLCTARAMDTKAIENFWK